MHEMPYTQSLLETALKAARGRKISQIHLRVGRLSAIVPESVDFFFDFLSKGTLAEGARLIFEMEPIALTCRYCDAVVTLPHDESVSARQSLALAFKTGCVCKHTDFKVSGGLGFDLSGIDVA